MEGGAIHLTDLSGLIGFATLLEGADNSLSSVKLSLSFFRDIEGALGVICFSWQCVTPFRNSYFPSHLKNLPYADFSQNDVSCPTGGDNLAIAPKQGTADLQ